MRKISVLLGFVAMITMISFGVRAQDITMATWGGGSEKTWKEAFAQPFAAETGINVKIVSVSSPEAQLRNPESRSFYDVAIVSYAQAANLLKDGLLETFASADLPASQATDPKYLLKTSDGRLVGASPFFDFFGIAINTTLAKKSDFQSWSDLADPKWKGKLAVTRPIFLATFDLPALAFAQGGDEKNIAPGVELLKKILPNVVTTYTSMAQMNNLLTRGEIAAGPYYSARTISLRRQGATDIDIVIPKEGALMIPYIVVVPKGAKNLPVIVKWLNFIYRPEPQARAFEIAGSFPLNKDTKLSSKSENEVGISLQELMPRLHHADWTVIAATQKERANLAEQLVAGVK